MSEQKFRIVWPECRFVSANQIKVWYHDGVANGDIGRDYLGLEDVSKMAAALHDAGTITLGA